LRQAGDECSGHIRVTAEDEEAAERVEEALEGLRAAFWLGAEPAPKLQELLAEVEVERDGKVVEAEFEAPAEEVAAAMPGACKLIEQHLARHHEHKMAVHHKMAKHGKKTCPAKDAKDEPAKKSAKKKPAEKPKKPAKPEKPKKGTTAAEERQGMKRPTARQGTPVLGVVIGKPLDAEAAEVVRVWEGSPAAKAGLRPGDRIVKVDGEEIGSPEDLRATVLRHKPGDKVELVVLREGEQEEIEAKLAGGSSPVRIRSMNAAIWSFWVPAAATGRLSRT